MVLVEHSWNCVYVRENHAVATTHYFVETHAKGYSSVDIRRGSGFQWWGKTSQKVGMFCKMGQLRDIGERVSEKSAFLLAHKPMCTRARIMPVCCLLMPHRRENSWYKHQENGGWGGIRTHGTLSRSPVFKAGSKFRSSGFNNFSYFPWHKLSLNL